MGLVWVRLRVLAREDFPLRVDRQLEIEAGDVDVRRRRCLPAWRGDPAGKIRRCRARAIRLPAVAEGMVG